MFCRNCGANIPDEVKFCSVCGQTVEAEAAPVAEPAVDALIMEAAPAAPAAKKFALNKKTLIIIGAAAVAVILLFVLLFGGNSFQDMLEDNVNVLLEGDISDLEDLAPDCAWARLLDKKGVSIDQITSDDRYEDVAEQMAKLTETASSLGSMEYNVVDDMPADLETKMEIMEELLDSYGEYGLNAGMIGEVQVLKVELKTEALGVSQNDTQDMYAVEIDGDWYLMSDEDTFLAYETAETIIQYAKSASSLSGLLG